MNHSPDNRPIQRGHRHRWTWTALLALAASVTLGPAPVHAEPTRFTDVTAAVLSSAGESAVFTATNSDGRQTVYHLDFATDELTDLVVVPDARRSGDTVAATLSGDGCVVVAVTQIAFDLFRDDDTALRWDVYRLVLPHCDGRPNDWQLVSDGADQLARDDISPDRRVAVSADGATIAFTVPTDGVDGDDEMTTVAIVDASQPIGSPRRHTTVPGWPENSPTGAYHYRGADQPALSGDGTVVAFRADFDPLNKAWNDGPKPGGEASTEVVVWDRARNSELDPSSEPSSHPATVSPLVAGGVSSSEPALSADGSTLAFIAPGSAAPGCTRHCPTQVYRWNLDPDSQPELVSAQPWDDANSKPAQDGSTERIPGDARSWSPTLNANGTLVAFVTNANNLTIARPDHGGRPSDGTLMLAGTIAGEPWLSAAVYPADSDEPSAKPLSGAHHLPSISGDGAIVMFDTAKGLVLPDRYRVPAVTSSGRQLGIARVEPRLEWAQLDFGTVTPEQQSAELYTSVRNLGPASFQPRTASITDDDFEVTGGSCLAEVLVAPGEACTVRVVYTPGGADSAELVLAGDRDVEIRTTIAGNPGNPRLRIDPAGADLGRMTIDRDAETAAEQTTLTVTNIALSPTVVESVFVAGNHPDDFTISTDSCTGTELAPEQHCTVEATFAPNDQGYRSASITARTTLGDTANAVVGGLADRIPSLAPVVEESAPGATIDLDATGLEPGSSVWTGVVDERGLTGPFTVDEDGNVNASVVIPARLRDATIEVALGDQRGVVGTAAVTLLIDDEPTPSFLPGFGYG